MTFTHQVPIFAPDNHVTKLMKGLASLSSSIKFKCHYGPDTDPYPHVKCFQLKNIAKLRPILSQIMIKCFPPITTIVSSSALAKHPWVVYNSPKFSC